MLVVVNARFLTQGVTGVQRFAMEICLRLKHLLKDVEFVTPEDVIQKEAFRELNAKIVGSHHGHLWEQLDLPKYLKSKGKPLLVNLANTAPLFYKNKIVTVHDVAYKVFPQTYPKLFLLYYNLMIPRLLNGSRHVVTVSQFSKEEICRYYQIDNNKVSVVYNAVSEHFKPLRSTGDSAYFLAVSSMNYRKNFIYILDAFCKYQEMGSKESLYIIGDLKNASFKEIDLCKYTSNPKIKFLGRVSDEDLIKFYSNAVAFVYPSLYEGFGIPPLEAQACGCPAICAQASCLPEVFGDSVLYCNPYDSDSLVCAFKKIVSDKDLRKSLCEKGNINTGKYSWEMSAKKLRDIIVNRDL